MKRKNRTSSLNSSPVNLPPAKLSRNPMKRKKRTSSLKSSSDSSYLPNDCWESIFRFIINDNDDNNNHCNLNSLSLVSKQFLSITNRLLFSLTVRDSTRPFLLCLFERFTDLNSLDLSDYSRDLGNLLCKISRFPLLKLTSLNISSQNFFPANGLRLFSQKITTLTSLTCSHMFLYKNDMLLIADCFPLLKELNLGPPLVNNQTNFISGIHFMLSKCRCIQHLDLNSTYFLHDQHIFELSLFLRDLVSINLSECHNLTESTLFPLVRNCPSLSEIKMDWTAIGKESVENSNSLKDIGVYPQLKSLYLGYNLSLSDKHIIMFASMFPNLELLDLDYCNLISQGIFQVLRKCCKIRHLNLARCSNVKLDVMNIVVPKLEVLNLSFTKVDDQALYVMSKNCCGLLKLLLNNCVYFTKKGLKHVVENCTQLREIDLGGGFKLQK